LRRRRFVSSGFHSITAARFKNEQTIFPVRPTTAGPKGSVLHRFDGFGPFDQPIDLLRAGGLRALAARTRAF
jgi:hypothetical protein